MEKQCQQCGSNFEAKSERAKYCSDKCRKNASRSRSPVETTEGPISTEDRVYRYRTYTVSRKTEEKEYSEPRTARTWIDVPLNGDPILQEGWPEKPDYMNNRQYYLWWDNHFKTDEVEYTDKETGEVTKQETPVITNPYPKHDKVVYDMGGESSAKWGVH